jgi:hypothetical protein
MLNMLGCVVIERQTNRKPLSSSPTGDGGKELVDRDDVVETAQVAELAPEARALEWRHQIPGRVTLAGVDGVVHESCASPAASEPEAQIEDRRDADRDQTLDGGRHAAAR